MLDDVKFYTQNDKKIVIYLRIDKSYMIYLKLISRFPNSQITVT